MGKINIDYVENPTPEQINKIDEMYKHELITTSANEYDRIIEADKARYTVDYTKCELAPCNATVVVSPYKSNPYLPRIKELSTGLITNSGEFLIGRHKSNETGEMEDNKRGIWCCKVIATGPQCKNVQVGEDVFVNFLIAAPVPFGDYGYYAMSEQNIICSIRPKENEKVNE